MGARIDGDLQAVARLAQRRRREARRLVAAGAVPHRNFMSGACLRAAMERNYAQVVDEERAQADRLTALADLLNYALFLVDLDPAQA